MRLISRLEEIILLAIWKLEDDAYGLAILEEIRKATGKTWLTGSIYASLGRLLKHGLVESFEGDPVPERGGGAAEEMQRSRAFVEGRGANAAAWSELAHVLFNVKEFIYVP